FTAHNAQNPQNCPGGGLPGPPVGPGESRLPGEGAAAVAVALKHLFLSSRRAQAGPAWASSNAVTASALDHGLAARRAEGDDLQLHSRRWAAYCAVCAYWARWVGSSGRGLPPQPGWGQVPSVRRFTAQYSRNSQNPPRTPAIPSDTEDHERP